MACAIYMQGKALQQMGDFGAARLLCLLPVKPACAFNLKTKVLATLAASALADTDKASDKSLAQQANNPIANMISVPF